MGHISDRTLDNLLDGTIDDASELAIEEHVRRCDRCAHRLREWELLFPQIKSLIPTGEHPVVTPEAAAAPPPPSVVVQDWNPPRAPRHLPANLAWVLVAILAAGAGWLLYQETRDRTPTVAYLPEPFDQGEVPGSGETAGLGSGIATPPAPEVVPVVIRDSVPSQPLRGAAPPASREPAPRETQSAAATSPPPAEQDVRRPSPARETASTFPVRTESPRAQTESPKSDAESPLPEQFQRVTLGDALNRMSGTVRLISGLTPMAVEIAQGSALPGADPSKAVVRIVYNAPEGRLIMDQQRVGGGRREPSIAISTAANGVSVAQWVDRGGYWISLAGRADRETLLSIANRVQ